MTRECGLRSGITWLEVVVGVLVVGCLASLAATALPGLREMARARQCRSNLAQLGLALHSYHDTHRSLPPAAFWVAGSATLRDSLRSTLSRSRTRTGSNCSFPC